MGVVSVYNCVNPTEDPEPLRCQVPYRAVVRIKMCSPSNFLNSEYYLA